MQKKDKIIIYILLIGITSFFLIIFALRSHIKSIKPLYTSKIRVEKSAKYNYPYFEDHKDIYIRNYIGSISDVYADSTSYVVNFLDDYIVIFFKLYKEEKIIDYHNMIFYNEEIISIDEIITDKEMVEQEMYKKAYNNKFTLTKNEISKSKKSFLFKEASVDIFISNYNDKGSISLITLDYNSITDYLNFYHKLNKDYVLEDDLPITTQERVVNKDKKLVSFTFDDGPSSYTLPIADELEKVGARATYFVVGYNIPRNNTIIHELHEREFEIANHTTDHSLLTKYSCEVIKSKVEELDILIESITNKKPTLIRPPYGGINNRVKECIDMPFILWNVDSRDWEYRDKEKIVNEVMQNIKDGDIVLFHDLYEPTLEAVKELIVLLYADDFEIVTVSELFTAREKDLISHHAYRSVYSH